MMYFMWINILSMRFNVCDTMCSIFQSLPRLEGTIHSLPRTVYAGDLRCLTMELRNPSKTPVKVYIYIYIFFWTFSYIFLLSNGVVNHLQHIKRHHATFL